MALVFVLLSLLRRLVDFVRVRQACLVYFVVRVSVCYRMLSAVCFSHFCLICSVLCCILNSVFCISCLW